MLGTKSNPGMCRCFVDLICGVPRSPEVSETSVQLTEMLPTKYGCGPKHFHVHTIHSDGFLSKNCTCRIYNKSSEPECLQKRNSSI